MERYTVSVEQIYERGSYQYIGRIVDNQTGQSWRTKRMYKREATARQKGSNMKRFLERRPIGAR